MRAVRALPIRVVRRGVGEMAPLPNSTANCTPLAFAHRQIQTRWLVESDGQLPCGTDTIQVERYRGGARYRACFASTPPRPPICSFSRSPSMCTRYTSLLTTLSFVQFLGLKNNRKILGICMGLWSGNLDRFVIFVYLNIPP